jgi:peptide/nickel transport system ATP-binding protein
VTASSQVLTGPEAAGRPLLEARGLTKHFPAGGSRFAGRSVVHAVDDVSLGLAAGSITAIVGESGSGKSTLAKLLARLIKPTSGSLVLDGQAIPASSRAGRRYARQVQLVLQDPFASLNPIHDVRYHLVRPLKLHGMPVPGGTSAAEANGAQGTRQHGLLDQAVADLLARVAVSPPETFAVKYPHELSGGQRQRVAIARALAVAPAILLADEPVSMLDVSIRLGVLNLLADLRERDGLTIVYVTHDIASARYLADTIAVMYAGRIVETGPAASVTDQPAHPYTQLLLSAAPDPDRAQAPSLRGRGAPPNLVTPPPGCRFHPRCPHAMQICTQEVPPPTQTAAGQASACWLHASGLSTAQRAPLKAADRHAASEPPPPHPDGAAEPGKEA